MPGLWLEAALRKPGRTLKILDSVKLLLILVFITLTTPAAIHALARSALRSGLEPWTRPKGPS